MHLICLALEGYSQVQGASTFSCWECGELVQVSPQGREQLEKEEDLVPVCPSCSKLGALLRTVHQAVHS